ncbi:unnamed protein product [Leptosia nina]|uniref:Uncharacterized protein n=1 Tax=Leptosia nina TaxID=320188 RepID=A0AAV1JZ04_9NEOP
MEARFPCIEHNNGRKGGNTKVQKCQKKGKGEEKKCIVRVEMRRHKAKPSFSFTVNIEKVTVKLFIHEAKSATSIDECLRIRRQQLLCMQLAISTTTRVVKY